MKNERDAVSVIDLKDLLLWVHLDRDKSLGKSVESFLADGVAIPSCNGDSAGAPDSNQMPQSRKTGFERFKPAGTDCHFSKSEIASR
jgi:hypothetical protein